MKSEIIQEQLEDNAIEYPCLMQGKVTGCIVLFTARRTGFVVKEGDDTKLGHHSVAWCDDSFEVFKGKLVLSND